MSEQQVPSIQPQEPIAQGNAPQVSDVQTEPPVPEPAPPIPQPDKRPVPVWLIGLVAIVLGSAVLFAITQPLRTAKPVTPSDKTNQTAPTPTPIRNLSTIATQSAFVTFDQSVASLSGVIRAYNIQDPSLSPPVLSLPLGFAQ